MSAIKLQGLKEKQQGVYYQVDADDKPIGVGGMGQVYKGLRVEERTGVTRPVAIKFMYADLPPQAVERARRESAIQLRNDNLVEMLGFIETNEVSPSGDVVRHYHVVSELLTGVSLFDVLNGNTKDRDGNDVPFAVKMLQDFRNDPTRFARNIVMGVLSGLMALHDAGYIHRDIDPSNIMLTVDGHVKLIDFGISKQMNTLTTNDKGLTVAGAFMGKPEYAAPELALGDIKHQNQTTDIYAVGILLYQCIVGHTPFEGARHIILEQQIKGKLPLGIIKDRGLRKIIATACEKKQELRYQSAAQMRVALEALNGSKRAMPSYYKYIAGGVAFAILAIVIVVVVVIRNHRLALMEEIAQQQLELQQKEADDKIKAEVYTLMSQAEIATNEGLNYDKDFYEKDLMQAYQLYSEAESMALKVDSALADSIAAKRAYVNEELDSAASRFLKQQSQAISEGFQDSVIYRAKYESVMNFLHEQKK